MLRSSRVAAALVFCVALSTCVAQEASEQSCILLENGEQDCSNTKKEENPKEEVCNLYLAESTIPNAGLGTFVAVDYEETDLIWAGDPMFPMVDVKYHQYVLGPTVYKKKDLSLNPAADFQWNAGSMGMQEEASYPFVYPRFIWAYAPGLTATVNCNMAILNFDTIGLPTYDTAGLHRSKDPGAGAFSPYHESKNFALTSIPAGGELFVNYGESYFTSRSRIYGEGFPLAFHFQVAEYITQKYRPYIDTLMSLGVWNLFITYFPFYRRYINALPTTPEQVEIVASGSMKDLYQPGAVRPVEELKANGKCIGLLRAGNSTIPQAGRGAFIKGAVSEGTSVMTTPLLFTPTSDFFNMYEGDWEHKATPPNPDNVIHHQIAYNYCMHHKESSLFLCPYGIGVNYINHGRTGDKANVKLRWLKDGELGHNATLLQIHPENMIGTAHPRIFLEYVATRDIEKGEEIFFDYGDEWQAAWDKHLAEFESKKETVSADYQSARDWNKENADAMIRTEKEQTTEPYPSHFQLKCIVSGASKKKLLKAWNSEHLLAYDCIVKRRKKSVDFQYYYSVVYKRIAMYGDEVDEQTTQDIDDMEWTEHEDLLPREALRFYDKAYTQDMYLLHSFRHPIGIPDNIFPDAWRGVFMDYREYSKRYDENRRVKPKRKVG